MLSETNFHGKYISKQCFVSEIEQFYETEKKKKTRPKRFKKIQKHTNRSKHNTKHKVSQFYLYYGFEISHLEHISSRDYDSLLIS